MFFRDIDCVVFREKSALTGGAEGLRYKTFPEVAQRAERKHASLIVFKMLVESQRALEFLDAIPNARAIWLFRNYQDVASSNLKKFGPQNGIEDLRPFLAPEQENWRSEGCSDMTVGTIRRLFADDMNPNDAAALFWYSRNRLFFEQELDDNPRVLAIEYESFVTAPARISRDIYDFAGLQYPGDKTTREISTASVRKGQQLQLSSEVQRLCEDLLIELRGCANQKK